ncbi:MAG TPA: glycosyltransferase family 2 protein [Vicinamibacterales bacterium]|nr:glycosyltransferase family 2 protein [Vicinamibacterales bacterium]
MLSVVVPVYNNELSLPRLLEALERVAARLDDRLEVVFVVDGATDGSQAILQERLPTWPLQTQLIELSRNFGAFAAIAAGLRLAEGDYVAVLAADLQEPPELMLDFHRILSSGEADVVFGHRTRRVDPPVSRWLSNTFWGLYRRFVVRDMPKGGIDVFGCTRAVRDQLVALDEANTNLIALVLWLGFRRAFVPYERRARREGRSGWSFGKRVRYALDSIFSFTDLPIRALLVLGGLGTLFALTAGVIVFAMWAAGRIPVLGYTPLMLVITFFGGITALGLGIVGQYLWLTLQNARRRPNYIVKSVTRSDARAGVDQR